MVLFLTCERKDELLCPDVVVLNSAEQRLHLHYEQIWTVLPRFRHCTDILQKKDCKQRIINSIQNDLNI